MTAPARRFRLVASNTDAPVIPLRARVEHSALRHAVLRAADTGLILRDGKRTTINGRTAARPTAAALDDLIDAGCIAWTGDPQPGYGVGGITRAGRRQLAAWDRSGRPSGGDAA